MIKGIGKAKMHGAGEPRNRKHTVAANHHSKKHSTIKVHKTGGKKHHKKGAHKTILA